MVVKKSKITKPKKAENKKSRELEWVLGVMAGLIILVLLLSSFYHSLNTVKYNGMTFQKVKVGELVFYYYNYMFKDMEGQQYRYNLYLRTNPKENNVSLSGEIILPGDADIYLSVNSTGLNLCEDGNLALGSLSNFLSSNLLSIKAAKPDFNEAKETNFTFANCKSKPGNVVILVQEGNETKITKEGNCHIIDVANCEIMKAVEKFEVQSIADAKARGQ
jgi:hypothetical protein